MNIYPLIDSYAIHYDTYAGGVYTITDDSITLTNGTLTAGEIVVDNAGGGTGNLTVDGNSLLDGTVTVGSGGAGFDAIAHSTIGAAQYLWWDASFANLIGGGNFGSVTGSYYSIIWGTDHIVSGSGGYNIIGGYANTSTAATASYSIMGGRNNQNSAAYCFNTGYSNVTSGAYSATIGFNNDATGSVSIAMGDTTDATADNTVAIGDTVIASAANATSIGKTFTNNTANSVAFGINAVDFLIQSGSLTTSTSDIIIDADSKYLKLGADQNAGIYYDGTYLVLQPALVGTGAVLIDTPYADALRIGNGTYSPDYKITFDTSGNNGVFYWRDTQDYFEFSDDILLAANERIYFGSTTNAIYQNTDLIIATAANLDIAPTGVVTIGDGGTTNYLEISNTGLPTLHNGQEIRFNDTGDSNYVGFKAPALTANQIWTLPTADGSDGEVLVTDGAGVLSWSSVASEKGWSFESPSGASGTYYWGGFYSFASSSVNLTQASTTQTYGTANSAYGAHALIVASGAGVTDGSDLVLTVSGTSITDTGTRTAADSEVIVADCTAAGANDYYETDKKWLGQITYTLSSTGGTAFNFQFNYGLSKYWDNNNTDFDVVGIEATWLAGANDASPNLLLRHHKTTGWTYNAATVPTPPSAICDMQTDYNTEYQAVNGENGAWKRSNLSQAVAGSGSEGIIFEVVTTANKTFDLGNVLVRITP